MKERARLEKDIARAHTNPVIIADFRRQEASGGMSKRERSRENREIVRWKEN